jgi:hypothetical protein
MENNEIFFSPTKFSTNNESYENSSFVKFYQIFFLSRLFECLIKAIKKNLKKSLKNFACYEKIFWLFD